MDDEADHAMELRWGMRGQGERLGRRRAAEADDASWFDSEADLSS